MKRMAMTAAVALVLVALAPSAAWAGEMTTHVVSRTSGAEIATALLSKVRDVELGSSSATVTVDADGEVRQIGVSAGQLDGQTPLQGETTTGLAKLIAVPFMLGTGIRFLRFLSRLGSM